MAPTLERTVAAHAKVNLVLRIRAREASGYHTIETLFQRVALHDTLVVRTHNAARTLVCDGPTMPADGLGDMTGNLAFRAALVYADAARWDTGWHIAIDKRVPVGGGLGGGSADAAAVLRAMESMCPTPLGFAQLCELGSTLGADVPFCVSEYSRAWGFGRGDRLRELPPLVPATVEVYAFRDGVNTGAAYAAFAEMRNTAATPAPTGDVGSGIQDAATSARGIDGTVADRVIDERTLSTWREVADVATNDFEQVVPELHAGVRALLPLIRTRARAIGASGVPAMGLMTGSGATCVVVYETPVVELPPPLSLPPHCTLIRTQTL